VPSLHGACVSAKHTNPAGQVTVQVLDPGTEYVPAGQAVQVVAPAAAKVPAAHMVATPYPHLEPGGQGRQLEDAATEYVPAAQKGLQLDALAADKVPPEQLVQLLAFGREKNPALHAVSIPFTHEEPAGHGVQLLAPAKEYEVPVQA
jgi:hypothetical protein